MKTFYAVKHKTEERYLTGASSAAPRLYTSEGKAKGAIKTIIGKRVWSRDKAEDWMVVEWTISERVVEANVESIPLSVGAAMTNKELIELLSEMPSDAKVVAHCPSDNYYYCVYEVWIDKASNLIKMRG